MYTAYSDNVLFPKLKFCGRPFWTDEDIKAPRIQLSDDGTTAQLGQIYRADGNNKETEEVEFNRGKVDWLLFD